MSILFGSSEANLIVERDRILRREDELFKDDLDPIEHKDPKLASKIRDLIRRRDDAEARIEEMHDFIYKVDKEIDRLTEILENKPEPTVLFEPTPYHVPLIEIEIVPTADSELIWSV